ncbi:MAG: type II toxin-antitoxin system VapC family toxin [Candidatus Obscuribacterales bacterium]|nr:type II toxin-antitoxin system VapC family toxin [Candidatus Obscuribacterales bacterium]
MTTYLLDTSVIIDVLNRKGQRVELLKDLLSAGNSLACCSINVTEIFAGMRPKEKVATELFINSLEYFSVTRDVAAQAGLLKRDWAAKGITLAVSDVTIAAVALAHNLTLITDNWKHYPMPALRMNKLS